MRSALVLSLLSSFAVLACSRATPPPPPSPTLQIEAEAHVRAKDPSSSCRLSGDFHVPRNDPRKVSGVQDWKGTATVNDGDVVVVDVGVVGDDPWSCEVECAVRQVGARISTTSKSPAAESRPPPACPSCRTASVTCVLHASSR